MSEKFTSRFAAMLCLALIVCLQHAAHAETFSDAQDRYAAGDDDGALKIYKRILSGKIDDKARSFGLLSISRIYRHKHDYPQSIGSLNQALLITNKSDLHALAEIYWKRGSMYAASGKPQLAIKDYTETMKDSTLSEIATINLLRDRCAQYEHVQQYDKALADLASAIKIADRLRIHTQHPDELLGAKGRETELLYRRAFIYGELGRAEEAKQDRATADKITAGI